MNQLELEIVKMGQNAIGAYEKGNFADFWYFSEKQRELKEKLLLEEYKQLSFEELIEVKW